MKRTGPAGPVCESALVDGIVWLSTLSQADWRLLDLVCDWLCVLLRQADRSYEAAGTSLPVDLLALKWGSGHWTDGLVPQLNVAHSLGATDDSSDVIAWVVQYLAGSKLVPDARWAVAFERPFRHVERYLEVARRAPELADLIAGMSEWTGGPDDLDLLARQLSL
jgi:hypothetical protein